jgi:nucleoside-diphosphate-sugar epimerase
MGKGDALIGYTGFVGSNILAQRPFDLLYNSKNIEDIQNREFNIVVCAGASGVKWWANKNPELDLASIQRLINCLKTAKANKFILISTIDVYSPVNEVDEDTPINTEALQPYAQHRRMLEQFIADNFDSLIIRLPGIFGAGLKKNVIFDLLSGAEIRMNPQSQMQFYWLKHIWDDIAKGLENNLKILNIASEPIILKEIMSQVFGQTPHDQSADPPIHYDMQTKYFKLWGMAEPYLYSQKQIIEDLKTFKKTAI